MPTDTARLSHLQEACVWQLFMHFSSVKNKYDNVIHVKFRKLNIVIM